MNDNSELMRRARKIDTRIQIRPRIVTIKEIAEILGLTRQAAYPIMESLEKIGIVKHVEKVGGYGDWYWIGFK